MASLKFIQIKISNSACANHIAESDVSHNLFFRINILYLLDCGIDSGVLPQYYPRHYLFLISAIKPNLINFCYVLSLKIVEYKAIFTQF